MHYSLSSVVTWVVSTHIKTFQGVSEGFRMGFRHSLGFRGLSMKFKGFSEEFKGASGAFGGITRLRIGFGSSSRGV